MIPAGPVQQRMARWGRRSYADDATTGIRWRPANAIVGSLIIVSAAIFIATPVGIRRNLPGDRAQQQHRQNHALHHDILPAPPTSSPTVHTLIVANESTTAPPAAALAIIAVPVIVADQNMPQPVRTACEAAAVGRTAVEVVPIVTLRSEGWSWRLASAHPKTAPLLFTALKNQFWSADLNSADGQPAGDDLPVRDEPVRGLAVAPARAAPA